MSNKNQAVKLQKMARVLKFWILEEGLYYPCSKYKGADQLRSYREADLPLCFLICENPIFSCRGSYEVFNLFSRGWLIFKALPCQMNISTLPKLINA